MRHKTQFGTALIAIAILLGCQTVLCASMMQPEKAPAHPCCPKKSDSAPAPASTMPCCVANSAQEDPRDLAPPAAPVAIEAPLTAVAIAPPEPVVTWTPLARSHPPDRGRFVLFHQFLI